MLQSRESEGTHEPSLEKVTDVPPGWCAVFTSVLPDIVGYQVGTGGMKSVLAEQAVVAAVRSRVYMPVTNAKRNAFVTISGANPQGIV